MSSVKREDRDNLHAMHHAANGTGSSASDASRKRYVATERKVVIFLIHVFSSVDDSTSKPIWTKPPQVILPPGSQVSNNPFVFRFFLQIKFNILQRYPSGKYGRQSGAGSPFQQGQFDSLHDRARRGNPNAGALVPPPLRQRSNMTSKAIISDAVPAPKRRKTEQASHQPNDEDEDLGVLVPRASIGSPLQSPSTSSDDLRLISPRANSYSNGAGGVGEILGLSKPSDGHAFSQGPPPSAGPHTRALKTQVKNHRRAINGTVIDEPEAIEDADDMVSSMSDRSKKQNTAILVQSHLVRDAIGYFESRARPPEVDLKTAGKNKPRVNSMKKKVRSNMRFYS
jgi:hypothetical protein